MQIGTGGDLITEIDGKPVETQDALRRAMNQKKAGDKLVLTVLRGGKTSKIVVTLGSAPEAL
jgi:S1-C subfamily serine protease